MSQERTLLDRAIEYCGLLTAGAEILDDTDGEYVAPFEHLLGATLFPRGLYLERRRDRYVVTSTPPWEKHRAPPPWLLRRLHEHPRRPRVFVVVPPPALFAEKGVGRA